MAFDFSFSLPIFPVRLLSVGAIARLYNWSIWAPFVARRVKKLFESVRRISPMSRTERKYCLISTSYLSGLFDIFILLHNWQNCAWSVGFGAFFQWGHFVILVIRNWNLILKISGGFWSFRLTDTSLWLLRVFKFHGTCKKVIKTQCILWSYLLSHYLFNKQCHHKQVVLVTLRWSYTGILQRWWLINRPWEMVSQKKRIPCEKILLLY